MTWIGSSRLALIAMRRKFATDTPGIETGYWKARNSPALRALVRLGLGDVLALERDRALGDLVGGVAEQGVRERRLARAVGAHQRVDLAAVDVQVDASEDLALLGADVQVSDL